MRRPFLLAICGAMLAISACHSENKPVAIPPAAASAPRTVLKDSIQNTLFVYYLDLKESLVRSDTAAAARAGNLLAGELVKKDGCEEASVLAKKISQSAGIEAQRTAFDALNTEMIPMFRQSEVAKGSVFVQFCPMAAKGKGAYWLASERSIRNPYYGDEMLTCGEVKEVIK